MAAEYYLGQEYAWHTDDKLHNRIDIYLRPPHKLLMILPTDLTRKEAERLKQYIDIMTPAHKEYKRLPHVKKSEDLTKS